MYCYSIFTIVCTIFYIYIYILYNLIFCISDSWSLLVLDLIYVIPGCFQCGFDCFHVLLGIMASAEAMSCCQEVSATQKFTPRHSHPPETHRPLGMVATCGINSFWRWSQLNKVQWYLLNVFNLLPFFKGTAWFHNQINELCLPVGLPSPNLLSWTHKLSECIYIELYHKWSYIQKISPDKQVYIYGTWCLSGGDH